MFMRRFRLTGTQEYTGEWACPVAAFTFTGLRIGRLQNHLPLLSVSPPTPQSPHLLPRHFLQPTLLFLRRRRRRRRQDPTNNAGQSRGIRFLSLSTPPSARSRSFARTVATASASSEMVKAIRVHEFGGPEVLKWEDVEIGEPKEGEIRVKNKAIGVNFIDVYFRRGVDKAPTMPFTPGMEAVGEIVAVGPGLTGRKVGDIVAYAGVTAPSVMLKGMTAQFLLRRCFKVENGHTVLVQAAAGGVGPLLCQWANALGATVIDTVSTKEKSAQAKDDSCHHAIIYTEEDFVSRVKEITSGNGLMLCMTRLSLMQYAITRDELLEAAGEVFASVASGVLKVRVNDTYPLSEAAKVHADLESRKTSGSVVLIP
ncbi:hypothetical protein NL676_016288 [Syzygium grande]|nr:hypothetical protein NL676_016288 [Syzygium grande]